MNLYCIDKVKSSGLMWISPFFIATICLNGLTTLILTYSSRLSMRVVLRSMLLCGEGITCCLREKPEEGDWPGSVCCYFTNIFRRSPPARHTNRCPEPTTTYSPLGSKLDKSPKFIQAESRSIACRSSIARLLQMPCKIRWEVRGHWYRIFLRFAVSKIWSTRARLNRLKLTATDVIEDVGLSERIPQTERRQFVERFWVLGKGWDSFAADLDAIVRVSRVDDLWKCGLYSRLFCWLFDGGVWGFVAFAQHHNIINTPHRFTAKINRIKNVETSRKWLA